MLPKDYLGVLMRPFGSILGEYESTNRILMRRIFLKIQEKVMEIGDILGVSLGK